MNYVRVKNWERHQHQATKRLPWIKFFTELLEPTRNPRYTGLSDTSKCLLHHIWLMASVFSNEIPEEWINREKLNLQSRVNLAPLVESGYVEVYSKTDSEIALSRTRDARSDFSPSHVSLAFDSIHEFDVLWGKYPRPIGRKAALAHFKATVTTAADLDAIGVALGRYLIHAATLEPQYVQHGSTWFNNWRDWVSYVPPVKAKILDSSLTIGGSSDKTLRERMTDVIDEYMATTPTLRPMKEGPARDEWDTAFREHFGFTVREWSDYEVDDATIEKWLEVSA